METKVAQIRRGRPDDSPKLAEVYADAWRGAYQGIIPHKQLERLIALRGPGWWDTAIVRKNAMLVLDFGGEALGYATYGRSRLRRSAFQGEIYEIYIHPVYQGLGFGEQLFSGARKCLANAGVKGLVVWALADNDAACNFYLNRGGEPVAEGSERFGDMSLRKIAFAWR
ncbi:GNAT family N-acetyltransferase [Methyloligella solikamskensis]|uniref:GNAT family N-acetyltransferase n=1 Tax=Methyloligella solikamskensis TaxID=1177756 RepID=A0ABW3J5X3_9HYPH